MLLAEGKPDAALSIVQQAQEEADRLQVLPIVLQGAGRKAEADQSLRTLIARFADTAAYWVAANYAYRGDCDLAFEWLERAYQQKDNNLVTFVGEPLFQNLAIDPRYKALLRKMNLPE